jgi:hypothetical protein
MRAHEFLLEANLANNELRKHSGKYLQVLVRKIQDGNPIAIAPVLQQRYGEQVIIKKTGANALLQAYFGSNTMPDIDGMNLGPNGDLIPVSNPNKVDLETTDGESIAISSFQKTPDFKSGKDFNAGDIGEAALGAAVYARFLARKKKITEQDVLNIFSKLKSGKLLGKNNLKGSVKGKSSNDAVYFNLSLNTTSYKAMVGAGASGQVHPQILGAVRSAVVYANTSEAVQAAVQHVIIDKNANSIIIEADGVTDQSVKADLFLTIDGTTVNLLSLKAGDVKQFGQESGYNFKALERFFNSTFGVNIDNRLKDNFVAGDPIKSFEAIHIIYTKVGKQIQRELQGHVVKNEATFIQRLYKGISHHATREDNKTSMVILKTTPNAPGFTDLQFGKAFKNAMQKIDMYATYDAPGKNKPAKIEIFGKSLDDDKDLMFLRLRSNFKSEGKGYVRNIVEMGPLLKKLATIQKSF